MSIETGRKLRPCDVIAPIASGGMGEVYKATDARLERTVAVKVLPEDLLSRPDLALATQFTASAPTEPTPEQLERLRSLGYIR